MEDEELLKMAEALEEVEDLTASDRKFVEKILEHLGEEKRITRKEQETLKELYKEHLGEEPSEDDEIDEDDFV